jgi:GAF domain-containing protein
MRDSILASEGEQAHMLERILTVGQAMQQHILQDPTQVYQLIVETVCEMTGADCAVIYPYHPSYGEFYDVENVAACGLRHELPVEKGADRRRRLSARVHQRGEVIREDIDREEPDVPEESSFVVREAVKAFMGLSLRVGDTILGILYVDYRKPHQFSDGEKRSIRLLGQQAAMAISNSWTFRLASIRANTIAKLKTVGQALVAIEDPSETLDSVLEGIAHSAQEVLDADIVDLYQYVQDRNDFILPPTLVGERRHSHVPKKIYNDDVVIGVIKIGEAQYFHDAQRTSLLIGDFEVRRDDAPDQRFVVREGVISSAMIPLKVAEETVGVMFVNYRTSQLFSPEQRDVIESFAAQAAVAIHNARLFQRAQRQRQQSETLRAQLLTATLRREEVVGLVLDQLRELIEYDSASIQLIQGDQRTLIGGRGFVLTDSSSALLRGVSQDALIRRIVSERRSLVLSDVKDEPLWHYMPQTANVNSWIGVPLLVRGRVIGLLTLDHHTAGYYTHLSGQVVTDFANQVATAIHNTNLFKLMSDQARALAELNELAPRLISVEEGLQDSRSLLERIARSAQEALGADLIDLYEYLPERNSYRLPPVWVGQRQGPEVLKDRIHEDDAVFQLIHRREPLYVEDSQLDPVLAGPYSVERAGRPSGRFVVREGIRSTAAIPLRTGNQALGLMFASYRSPQSFPAEQREIIQLFASQAALVINYSRLFDALERRVGALRALNEVGQALTSGIRLREDEILELIYGQARRLIDTQDMYIALYDEETRMIRFGLVLTEGRREEIESRKADMERWGRTEEVIFTKQPLLHRTLQEAQDWYASPGHQEFIGRVSISWLGVPMLVGEKVLGVIAIWDWEREHVYDELDRQVLASMATQAAIALDNANLYYDVNQALEQANRDLERRVEALGALNEIGQTLTSGLRLREDEILDLTYEQACRLTGTQDMYIALYDEETGMIRFGLVLTEGRREEIESRQADMEKRGRTEEVIFTQQPLLHRTLQEAQDWYASPGHQEFIGRVPISWLGVPMLVGERVLGVIAVWDWEQETVYDQLDRQVLASMATQAAIALDNANLYYDVNQALEQANRALARRLDQIQTVQEISNAVQTYKELPVLLQSILKVSLPHLHAQAGTIQLLDRAKHELVVQAAVGAKQKGQHQRISLEQGITGQAAREGHAIYVPDASQDERFLDYLGQMRSELAIPLKAGGEIIGVFNIEDPQVDAFDENTRELAEMVAAQVAITIQNAQRREELIANRQLAALGTATAAIHHRVNNTLNIIGPNLTRLRRRVDTSDATIQGILDIIERNTKYTSDYIARIQEPLKETEIQLVDVNLCLRDAQVRVWAEYQHRSGLGPVEVTYDLCESPPPIEASLAQITEIFRNLIENSYKAMGAAGGDLAIASRCVGDWLEVEIQDTGPGIPANILDRLFVKPVPSKKPGEGSGLGLWLSRLLLQKYAGEILIKETGPDGTTVLVRLPASRP